MIDSQCRVLYAAKQPTPADLTAAIDAIRARYSQQYAQEFILAGEDIQAMIKANAKLQAASDIFIDIYKQINTICNA